GGGPEGARGARGGVRAPEQLSALGARGEGAEGREPGRAWGRPPTASPHLGAGRDGAKGREPGRAWGRPPTESSDLGPGRDGGKRREPGRAWGRPPTESSDLRAPATMTATTITIPAEGVAARSEWLTLLRRLARRRTALFGLVVVALVFVAAAGAPWWSPWDPIEQDITNRLKPPGSPDPSRRMHVRRPDHLGPSLPVIIIVIGVSSWVVYARVVRGAVLSLREREFVQAAQALGSRDGRILVRHILPNAFTPWLVVATLDMARVIVIESALSF